MARMLEDIEQLIENLAVKLLEDGKFVEELFGDEPLIKMA